MNAACFHAAGICALGAVAAALPPARGGWSALGCGIGGVAMAAAALPLLSVPAGTSAAATSLAALSLFAALIGQLRLLAGRAVLLPGGLRGRLACAAAPAICAVTLAGLVPAAGLARPAAAFAVLLLAGLSMVAWRGRVPAASVGPLGGRIGGARLVVTAATGFALSGIGLLAASETVSGVGQTIGDGGVSLPPLAQVLLAVGAAVAIGIAPMQGMARSWLGAAPPWLAGPITAGTVGPALLMLLSPHDGLSPVVATTGPGSLVLEICGAGSIVLAGWGALGRRLWLSEAVWLALAGLIALGLGAGGPSGLSGAVLAFMIQVLLACLPAGLGRDEALAVLAGCIAPALLVGAALPAAALVALGAGAGGLLLAAFDTPPAPSGRDPMRWCVLILLLGGALVLPAPLAALLADIATTGAPA